MSGMDGVAITESLTGAPRSWKERLRVLSIAVSGAGMLWLLVTVLEMAGMVVRPIEQQASYALDSDASTADSDALVAEMQLRYPRAALTASPLASQVDAQGGSYAVEHCGDRAIMLEIRLRTQMFSMAAPLRELEAQAERFGFRQCAGSSHKMVRGNTSFGPLFGGGVMSLWLLSVFARSQYSPEVARRWKDWMPRFAAAPALAWGAAAAAVILFSGMAVHWLGQQAGMAAYVPSELSRDDLLLLAPMAILAAPLVEEYIFRAWLLERGARAIGAWPMLLWSSVVFTAVHLPQQPAEMLMLTTYGLGLGVLWLRTRSLLACFTAHALLNLISLAVRWIG